MLTKKLKKAGYDLIESPVRNHKLTQLWLKKNTDKIQMYYDQITFAMKSTIELSVITNTALTVNATTTNEYNFNLGLTALEEILKSMGVVSLDLSAEIKGGKKVSISYDDSITKEIQIGELEQYLSNYDFLHPNTLLYNNLNKNNVIVITGVLFAKNLKVAIETDFEISAELQAKLSELADGKIDFSNSTAHQLIMNAVTGDHYPIAVKANRLNFNKGIFKNHKMITDNRDLF